MSPGTLPATLFLLGLLVMSAGRGQHIVDVFRCVNDGGELSFQDTPCEQSSRQSLRRLDASQAGIQPSIPSREPLAEATREAARPADPASGSLRRECGRLDILAFSPRGISLEFTTAPELDGFWGDQRRGFLDRPLISTDQFSQDINDVAICADIEFRLKAYNGRINKGNNLGREMRAHFVARSDRDRIAPAMSGTFPDGSIRLGARYSGTYCFWRGSEGGVLEDVGCR